MADLGADVVVVEPPRGPVRPLQSLGSHWTIDGWLNLFVRRAGWAACAAGWRPRLSVGGINGAMATLIALWHREMTGQGQHIDVSMQAAVANTLETSYQTFDFNREIRTRTGHRRQAAAFILPCLDGFIAVLSTSRIGWPRLVEWLRDEGEGEAIADPKFPDDFYRFEHEDIVHQTLRDFFATRTKQAIYTEASGAACRWHRSTRPRISPRVPNFRRLVFLWMSSIRN